jgi:hypothetical protein
MTGRPPLLQTLWAVMALLATPFACAEAQSLETGVYSDGLMIGFDPATQIIRGYYGGRTGRGHFTCIFYLRGRLRGATAHVSTYFPETPVGDLIKGELMAKGSGRIRLALDSEHGGCWNVQHFADADQPADARLYIARPWTSVAVVRRDRAYLFDAPDNPAHRRAYVVRGDGVGVRATRPGWLQVEFIGQDEKRITSGWIRRSDVYPTD